MSLNRRAAKRDVNERKIVDALRSIPGVSVVQLSQAGVPDLLVGRAGKTYLMEIKGKYGKLTEPEQAFFDDWRGHAEVVKTIDEALKVIGIDP